MVKPVTLGAALAMLAGIASASDLRPGDINGATPGLVLAASTGQETAAPAVGAPFKAAPLHEAAFFGRTDDIRALLERGADPNAPDAQGWSPLNWAAGFAGAEIVAMLIEAGADVTATDPNGWTSLHWAAGMGSPETIRALVAAGAAVDAQETGMGWCPIHEAAANGSPENVAALLDAGADPQARNLLGVTPYDLARKNPRMLGSGVLDRLRPAR